MAVGIHIQHPTTGKYSQNGARGGHLPPHTQSAPPHKYNTKLPIQKLGFLGGQNGRTTTHQNGASTQELGFLSTKKVAK